MQHFPADDFSLPAGLTDSPSPESFALQEAPFFGKPLFQQGWSSPGPRGAHRTRQCWGTSQGTGGAASLGHAAQVSPDCVRNIPTPRGHPEDPHLLWQVRVQVTSHPTWLHCSGYMSGVA